MVDEIYDRLYQEGRSQMNDGLDRLFAGISRAFGDTLKVLHRIEWSAPWASRKPVRRV